MEACSTYRFPAVKRNHPGAMQFKTIAINRDAKLRSFARNTLPPAPLRCLALHVNRAAELNRYSSLNAISRSSVKLQHVGRSSGCSTRRRRHAVEINRFGHCGSNKRARVMCGMVRVGLCDRLRNARCGRRSDRHGLGLQTIGFGNLRRQHAGGIRRARWTSDVHAGNLLRFHQETRPAIIRTSCRHVRHCLASTCCTQSLYRTVHIQLLRAKPAQCVAHFSPHCTGYPHRS